VTDYIRLGYGQVALAALLILVNGAISLALRLDLEKRLLVASLRTVVQLLLVGLVLEQIFAVQSPPLVLVWMLFMATVAGIASVRRTGRRYPGIWWDSVLCIWLASWVITGMALTGIVRVDPWWKAQYAIPLLGMILGNALNGISLGLDRLGEELTGRRGEVELRLALGASRWQAALPPLRSAIRTGMIPIVNSMSIAGLVSLPGMMTGQLLAGVSPLEAVKYQIVIMFLIAAGTALGTVGVVLLGYRRLFNRRHQFLAGRLYRV
jgi:putative ABC transport system permease protein